MNVSMVKMSQCHYTQEEVTLTSIVLHSLKNTEDVQYWTIKLQIWT